MIEKTVAQLVEDTLGYALAPDDPVRYEVDSAVRRVPVENFDGEIDAALAICDGINDRDPVAVRLVVAQAVARDAAEILAGRIADKLGIEIPGAAPVDDSNPSTWPVQLIRTDKSGRDVNPRRLVFVWGYAAAGLDFDDIAESRARVLRLHDLEGTLCVYWSSRPTHLEAGTVRVAWTRGGGEGKSRVEHWVGNRLVMTHDEDDQEDDNQ